jgi:hypothetical protein
MVSTQPTCVRDWELWKGSLASPRVSTWPLAPTDTSRTTMLECRCRAGSPEGRDAYTASNRNKLGSLQYTRPTERDHPPIQHTVRQSGRGRSSCKALSNKRRGWL